MACVASSKVEFRCLHQGGVFSGVSSEQQGGVPLSPPGWGFQWCEQLAARWSSVVSNRVGFSVV